MKNEELNQFEYISKMSKKVYEMYEQSIIEKTQIGKIWNVLALLPNIPYMWPSRILEKTNRVELIEEELGKDWAKILGLFAESPSYLINHYCPENNIDFSISYFKDIIYWIDYSVRELKTQLSEKDIEFEGIL